MSGKMFTKKQTLQLLQQMIPPPLHCEKGWPKVSLLVTCPEPLLLHKTMIWWFWRLFYLERVNNRGIQKQLPCLSLLYVLGMGIFGNFLFRSSIGIKKRLIEYSGVRRVWGGKGGLAVMEIMKISED